MLLSDSLHLQARGTPLCRLHHTCQRPGSQPSRCTRPADAAQHCRASRRWQCSAAAVAEAPPVAARRAKKPHLPFVKVAGQEDMKLALLLNIVDPLIGGVLVMGDRGTGKSVAVRAMAEMLPDIEVVAEDPFNSSPTDQKFMGPDAFERYSAGEVLPSVHVPTPLVELPLGATEDRICGTIDVEKALQAGVKAYEPGLLARANRGILYVDEVNLLDDGLVDVVLDSAASGVNVVEREGISITHPARFIMIGSGNPQEGEMRPQLLDRFGLCVNVATMQDIKARTQMVLDRLAYEQEPDKFCDAAEPEQAELRAKLQRARDNLSSVKVSGEVKLKISEVCSLLGVDGIRGDITTNRAARAFVALEGRPEATMDDVARVIALCVNHRLRKDPLDPIDGGTKVALAFQRVMNPKAAEARKQAEEEAKKREVETKKPKQKAGSWGGLP